MEKIPYDVWLKLLNFLLDERVGLSVESFENMGEAELIAMHAANITPQQAATNIISSNDLFETGCEECDE